MAKIQSFKKVPENWVHVSFDFSGEELRLAANMSHEDVWVNTFLTGGDLHKQTAISMVGEHNYTKSIRKVAKGMNFAMLYLAQASSFVGMELNGQPMNLAQATKMVKAYKKGLPKLMSWQEKVCDNAVKTGTVRSFFGRPRRVSPSVNANKVSQAKRFSANHIVQSTGGDLLKIAFLKLWKNGIMGAGSHETRFLNTVHDEINFGVKFYNYQRLEKVMTKIKSLMDFKLEQWPVPVVVDGSFGKSFGLQMECDVQDGQVHPKLKSDVVYSNEIGE